MEGCYTKMRTSLVMVFMGRDVCRELKRMGHFFSHEIWKLLGGPRGWFWGGGLGLGGGEALGEDGVSSLGGTPKFWQRGMKPTMSPQGSPENWWRRAFPSSKGSY